MKYGIREVCDVTFKAKNANTKIGNKVFAKDEPVLYIETAKTSSLEGSADQVFARGGQGNPKLITWEGEKEVTFTFEDALISEIGMSILLGAGIVESDAVMKHVVAKEYALEDSGGEISIDLTAAIEETVATGAKIVDPSKGTTPEEKEALVFVYEINELTGEMGTKVATVTIESNVLKSADLKANSRYVIDCYAKTKGTQLSIKTDKFSDYFYIEAETLVRNESGVDSAAQFIIPKGKIQSNFEISMANSGDPSTFTFVVEAMADYTKFNKKDKVLAEILIID